MAGALVLGTKALTGGHQCRTSWLATRFFSSQRHGILLRYLMLKSRGDLQEVSVEENMGPWGWVGSWHRQHPPKLLGSQPIQPAQLLGLPSLTR
jgi:hypothetical protein